MKIRTLDALVDHLSEDHAWRKKELAALRNMVESDSAAKIKQSHFIRAGIALLYAHFEGFVKSASQLYLNYVKYQQIPNNMLTPNFQAVALRNFIPKEHGFINLSSLDPLVSFINQQFSSQSDININQIIRTESNLSSKILKEIVWILGLDYRFYQTKERIIDDQLLYFRNHIAHGSYLQVDETRYIALHGEVIAMLEDFHDQIENSAVNRCFCREKGND